MVFPILEEIFRFRQDGYFKLSKAEAAFKYGKNKKTSRYLNL